MMKRKICLSLSIFTTIVAISQNAHLYNVKANIMWKGVANEMGFYVPGRLTAIDVEGGILEYEDSLNWAIDSGMSEGLNFDWETFPFDWMQRKSRCYIVPHCDARTVIVTLYYKDEQGEVCQSVKSFRLRKLDAPHVVFAGKKSSADIISRAQLLSSTHVFAVGEPESLFEGVKYDVVGFTVCIIDNKGNVIEKKCNSNTFTQEVVQEMSKVKEGYRIAISNIVAIAPCGEYVLQNMVLKVE